MWNEFCRSPASVISGPDPTPTTPGPYLPGFLPLLSPSADPIPIPLDRTCRLSPGALFTSLARFGRFRRSKESPAGLDEPRRSANKVTTTTSPPRYLRPCSRVGPKPRTGAGSKMAGDGENRPTAGIETSTPLDRSKPTPDRQTALGASHSGTSQVEFPEQTTVCVCVILVRVRSISASDPALKARAVRTTRNANRCAPTCSAGKGWIKQLHTASKESPEGSTLTRELHGKWN
ncbi:hypothetical protein ZHAS_00018556 [Anopheles sinensis]|uniref:Uncharacterized protein n=1 Tax=Anopheles sinensis TaxID=74873 RepID=A0A084WJX2_ANOSI|nr:hypothetical protein ZHAS_00018556 [Anopheles sinensis]